MRDTIKTISIAVLSFIIGTMIVLTLNSCTLDQVVEEDAPPCCKALYNIFYLTQNKKLIPDKKTSMVTISGVDYLIKCCGKQGKYDYCMEQKENERERCFSLMKTF